MRILRKPVPAEAIELVDQHGPDAQLIARTQLAQARDAGDDIRAARWQTLSDAISALLEDRKSDRAGEHAPLPAGTLPG
ncbi:hypothetical protein AA0522_2156 [Gluconacetobacter liquefaciens NRIC 0522]|uniref:Uncharacterized protein n=1 Tax=Gluconacetobacter liquefaciens TaxID=89584 RepID=A0A370G0D2_GLULI|nr:hypothetical protein C7453_10680 [Gluconacetobacter liquefaciens]GBR07105.1 hypothetical protein AA0522_2156 [Gluconacetobacter liquefaciens NRIC 0522]